MATSEEHATTESRAIHKGADLLVALIEKETARAAASVRQASIARFAQFRKSAALDRAAGKHRSPRSEGPVTAEKSGTNLTSTLTPESVNGDSVQARSELARTKKEFGRVTTALTRVGIYYTKGSALRFHGEWGSVLRELERRVATSPDITAQLGVLQSPSPVNPRFVNPVYILGELRRRVEWDRSALKLLQDKCRFLEQERDAVKAAMRSEISRLMAQIENLQDEVRAMKLLPPKLRKDGVKQGVSNSCSTPNGSPISTRKCGPE